MGIMGTCLFFYRKAPMKSKVAASEKPVAKPRVECPQTNYSEAALLMMEKATGQRFARTAMPAKQPVQAVDAE
jgi:hypothetical protein